jgi:hypothetical protein
MEAHEKGHVRREESSNVQLEGLELAANGVASWTAWRSSTGVFADKDVDALLTQAADAFGAGVAVSEVG